MSLRRIFLLLMLCVASCARGNQYQANSNDETTVKPPPAAPGKRMDPAESFGMTYTVHFTGPMPVSGSFSERVSSRLYRNCLDYVRRRNEGSFGFDGTVNGHLVQYAADTAVVGPGVYTPPPDSPVNLQFDSDASRYQFTGFAKDSPVKVTVNADGSGSLTLSNWKNDSGETESGSASWVCTK